MEKIIEAAFNSPELDKHQRSRLIALVAANGRKGQHTPDTVQNILKITHTAWMKSSNDPSLRADAIKIFNAWSETYQNELVSFIHATYPSDTATDVSDHHISPNTANVFKLVFDQLSGNLSRVKCTHMLLEKVRNCYFTLMLEKCDTMLSLSSLAILANRYSNCLPAEQIDKILIATVKRLAVCYPEAHNLQDFLQQLTVLGIFVVQCWSASGNRLQSVTTTLSTLFGVIVSANTSPSIALSVILQSVPQTMIRGICENLLLKTDVLDDQLSRVSHQLALWTSFPKHINIHIWLLTYARVLRNAGKALTHYQLVDQHIPSLVGNLRYTQIQATTLDVLEELLLTHQICPSAFHRCVTEYKIQEMFSAVKDESLKTRLSNLLQALMFVHPGYPEIYRKVSAAVPACLPILTETELQAIKDKYKPAPSIQLWNQAKFVSSIKTRSEADRVGLENLGNTCYLNSVVQALFMIENFRSSVITSSPSMLLLGELRKLFALIQHTSRRELKPARFVEKFQPSWFTLGRQQDSSEYLRFLLDSIHESSKVREQGSDPSGIFTGSTNFSTTCDVCQTATSRTEKFYDLSLHFNSEKESTKEVESLTEMLENSMKPERLEGSNLFHCDQCGCLCEATRRVVNMDLPACLTLTLCRFSYNTKTNSHNKLRTPVRYPESVELYDKVYNLTAVIVHSGTSLDGGHYYTYAKHSASDQEQQWYLLNDSRVSQCTSPVSHQRNSQSSLNYDTPYILFYTRESSERMELPADTALPSDLRQLITSDNLKLLEEQQSEARSRALRNAACQLNLNTLNSRRDDDDDHYSDRNDSILTGSRFVF